MTQNEKIMLRDLCMRLLYAVYAKTVNVLGDTNIVLICSENINLATSGWYKECKPYLRPMSSMTEEEENKYNSLNAYEGGIFPHTEEAFDWLNAHHFDYRGLIEKGLALEAPEGMYKKEE